MTRPRRTVVVRAWILALCLLAAGCTSTASSSGSNGPQSWIDAPLNATTIPLAPVRVVWHAAAAEGVSSVEFAVNGTPVEVVPADGGSFTMGERTWLPAAAGNYVISIRAQDQGGAWSPPATSLVTVVAEAPPPSRPSPTAAPTPRAAPTRAATLTPTSEPTATAATAASIERIRISTARVAYEGGGGCAPTEVNLIVRAVHPDGIRAVVVFYRLRNAASGEATEYFSRAMQPQGNDLYSLTVNPATEIISQVGFPGSGDGWLQHQAVIQTVQGDTSVRTPLLSDITVTGC